ncbi:MAG: CrcB family protein [Dehalococcoidia bacterium]|nr:CrcB family protein [Dehalococcoidia bacterium]MSQ34982.1 CrcB family protein [Dehalococcoidia bacterium]
MEKVLWLAVAGAAGTLARYGVTTLFLRYAPSGFPWGVFAINVAGSFLFGAVWVMGEERGVVGPNMRLIALTGFMGAFTTFSTFAFDSVQLARGGNWTWMVANLVLSSAAGMAAVLVGFRVGRAF